MSELSTEAEKAHRAAISVHCPNETEFAMMCRAEMASVRDRASIGMMRASDTTQTMLSEINRIATLAVYARASPKRLWLLRLALDRAMDAANALEKAMRYD